MRNLQELTVKIIEGMSITYNIEKDIRYKQGIEKGIEKEKTENVQRLLLETDFQIEKIASLARVSVAFVKRIKKELGKNK